MSEAQIINAMWPDVAETMKKRSEKIELVKMKPEEAEALKNLLEEIKSLEKKDGKLEGLKRVLMKSDTQSDKKYSLYLKKLWYFFFSETSAIHRHEAKEKYWILWRELESAMYSLSIELNFEFAGFIHKNSKEVDELINKFLKRFKGENYNGKKKTFGNLLLYARILSKQPLELLKSAEALNMMWRDITFVRSRLLTDNIITNERLSAHLEYCRLECEKVCSGKDDKIEQMCHETALEIVDNYESNSSAENQKARKTIAFILAMLNHIRLKDINAQHRIKKIYNVAFILLSILSLLLLHLNQVLTNNYIRNWLLYHPVIQTIELGNPISWIIAPIDFIVAQLHTNLLFYIFFAGLLGGFFSTVMRLRSKKVNISDVYLRSYLLTKPIVGALGATILYIIITSNIIPMDIAQMKLIDQFSNTSVMFGPVGFAFGFIMGFSERIILPTIKAEGEK